MRLAIRVKFPFHRLAPFFLSITPISAPAVSLAPQVTVNGEVKETAWKMKKLNPKWNEKFVFEVEAKSFKNTIVLFEVRQLC